MTIAADLNLSELNLDGSHAIAKKFGESVAYQGRSKAAIKGARRPKRPISYRVGFKNCNKKGSFT